jgi:hypothetical protein
METDVVVRGVSDALQNTLRRLSSLATGVALVAALISAATFATGLWIFQGTGRANWVVIGGAICLVPVVAAVMARFLMRRTARHSAELVANVRQFLDSSAGSAKVLIDHDTGQPIATYSKGMSGLRVELDQRRKELPALWASVRAITSVPGLAAISVLGMLCVGALGTILLIGGLID